MPRTYPAAPLPSGKGERYEIRYCERNALAIPNFVSFPLLN